MRTLNNLRDGAVASYKEIPPRVNLPEMELSILDSWNSNGTFEQSTKASIGKPRWVFYEGPPTANGKPGAHHVEARTFKDVFPRYRTMKGYHVERRAGWDCHGLPVEIEVEKELNFSGKKDIEKYGIAAFNAKCRESVLRHVGAFTEMTQRMGYWVNFDSAYWTMDPAYIESVWWSLKQIHKKGHLVEDHRVSPYCPRCGTGLSDHELAQGYQDVVDESAYVYMPLTSGPLLSKYPGLTLIAWTTTPWTLVSNTACAVGNEIEYSVVKFESKNLLCASALIEKVFGDQEVQVVGSIKGSEVVGHHYKRPLDWVSFAEFDAPLLHTVLHADFVTTADGTGIVHEAPAFGAEDLELCRPLGLPVINPISPDGKFLTDVPNVGGIFFKDADKIVLKFLKQTELLFKQSAYPHPYPHCWRCSTRLIYYAQPSWYIRTTAIKNKLIEQNTATNWFPGTIQWGRYGDWLRNNIDWALSRNRYWGTPLPIWRCEDGHQTVIESRSELSELTGTDLSKMDPHRPFIDDVKFDCPQCSKIAVRVPEVIDVWYDSGAMPFAQWGAPHQNKAEFEATYPADYICEAIDQTRGWFYSLMAIGTLVFDQTSYKNVVCLGHIQDEQGRKMSKSLGNVLDPMDLMNEHGADAIRWFMLASGSPWQARRLGHSSLQEVVRKNMLTYWATASFQALYGSIAKFDYSNAPENSNRPVIDQWLVSETNRLAKEVDHAMDSFDTQRAGRLIGEFIDQLSNWYVRRNRRRFWDGDPAALATLHEALRTLTLVMAPFTPFISDRIWQDLFVTTTDPEISSVHLASWPSFNDELINSDLQNQMQIVRSVVELGRTARADSKMRNRQPLPRALISTDAWKLLTLELREQISQELNVKELTDMANQGDLVSVSVKGAFKNLGKKHGANTQTVANALQLVDPAKLVAEIRSSGSAIVKVAGVEVAIEIDDLVITETPTTGWAVATNDGVSVALDLTLTEDLILEGLARETIRLIQETRKSLGLEVTDRIQVTYQAESQLASAISRHSTEIAEEVLAVALTAGTESTSASASEEELGLKIWITKV